MFVIIAIFVVIIIIIVWLLIPHDPLSQPCEALLNSQISNFFAVTRLVWFDPVTPQPQTPPQIPPIPPYQGSESTVDFWS